PAATDAENGVGTEVADIAIFQRAKQLEAIHRHAARANAHAEAHLAAGAINLEPLDRGRAEYIQQLIDADAVASAQAQQAGIGPGVELERIDAGRTEDFGREPQGRGHPEAIVVIAGNQGSLDEVVA